MSPAELLGAVILAALVLYALFGGADFGGGVWDLLASGERKREQRALVERAIGPIWEANHVWLILVVVLLFTGFPAAFAAISIALFVPLVLLLVGIVLRGAAFTFRTYDRQEDRVQKGWGLLFSGASVLAPLALGVTVGATASGQLRIAAGGSEPWAWLGPFPLAVGLLALALFSLLAATYLAVEATGALREDFQRRALGAEGVALAAALAAALLARTEAPVVFEGLTRRPWSVPLLVATASAALVAVRSLRRGRVLPARAAAAIQTALVIAGWGAAQHPFLVVPDLTLAAASAPRAVQVALLWALGAGALFLFPALYVLFRTFKGERPFSVLERRLSGPSPRPSGAAPPSRR
jgi:cytochrome d ubiquinol oxidase subunit II